MKRAKQSAVLLCTICSLLTLSFIVPLFLGDGPLGIRDILLLLLLSDPPIRRSAGVEGREEEKEEKRVTSSYVI